jgi:hypothetical protein
MAHLAIVLPAEGGSVEWLEAVEDGSFYTQRHYQ